MKRILSWKNPESFMSACVAGQEFPLKNWSFEAEKPSVLSVVTEF